MSINDLVSDAVNLGVSATEYTLKYFEISEHLLRRNPEIEKDYLHTLAMKRTHNYYVAYKKGLEDTRK